MSSRKEWMLGIPGHNEVVRIEDVLLLVKGGQLRPTDLVKRLGEPWRAANEISELVPHFADAAAAAEKARPPESVRAPVDDDEPAPAPAPPAPAPVKPAPPPPAPAERQPRTNITDRVARASRPPEATRSVPRAETGRVPRTAEKAPPKEEKKPEEPAPPKEEKKPEKKEEQKPTLSRLRDRGLPKPPPAPVRMLEPMVPKYYSPVDLLRSASLAFDPKKLLLSMPVALLTILWSIGMFRGAGEGAVASVISVFSITILVFGIALMLTGLAYVTRRQLEGKEYTVGEAIRYTGSSLVTALVYPLMALFPSLLSLAILWLLRLARNSSPGVATALKLGYILPMIFAFVAMLGALLYQIASMYVPSSAAVEGLRLGGAVRHTWSLIRRQWGRVVLHWLIVTVAVGVISAVCLGLAELAIRLPEIVFGAPEDETIRSAWGHFEGLFFAYRGLAYGLGLTLPISLLSTLGTLSYMALRHPESVQVSAYGMDDTSGSGIPVMRGPMDSTNPAETRPAPAEATKADGPGVTPAPEEEEISEDSDEQPLVKD